MASIDRRRALAGSAALAVGVPVLAACGSDSSSGDAGSSATSGPAGETLASAADVPVGGCFVVSSAKVVVTQPTKGDFKAFTAVCTHQGCLVETSTEGDIPCPCHSSKFSLEDGSPVSGPATSPLAAVDITVDGDSIVRA
jgi:nitrite reductase/ring-hydroxylating ferredoxin subunit